MLRIQQKKILRIGIIQQGRIIEERLLKKSRVTLGRSVKNTLVLPDQDLPKNFTLFEPRGKNVVIHVLPSMKGKISRNGRLVTLDELKNSGNTSHNGVQSIPVDRNTKGKIIVGKLTILFQFISPVEKRSQKLPAALRVSFFSFFYLLILDYWLAAALAVSAVAQIGAVSYLVLQDWPIPERNLNAEVERYRLQPRAVAVAPKIENPKTDEDLSESGDTEVVDDKELQKEKPSTQTNNKPLKSKESPEIRARKRGERKRLLSREVEDKTIIHLLGTSTTGAGDGGLMATLNNGELAQMDIEQALAHSPGGFITASNKSERSGLITTNNNFGDSELETISDSSLGNGKLLRKGSKVTTKTRKERKIKPRVNIRKLGKMYGQGTLDPNSVQKVIEQRQSQIQGCYERAIKKDKKLSGKLVIKWTIGSVGRVTKASVVSDTMKNSGVAKCVIGKVKRWRFSKPKGGSVTITKRFIFDVE